MSRINVVNRDAANAEQAQLLDAIESQLGMASSVTSSAPSFAVTSVWSS